jgi:hypothetical protein
MPSKPLPENNLYHLKNEYHSYIFLLVKTDYTSKLGLYTENSHYTILLTTTPVREPYSEKFMCEKDSESLT